MEKSIKGTKTEKNLLKAFAGESQARNRYTFLVCGHVYDEAEGDPIRGFPPGTKFEELPDDWTCPVCGVEKEEYVEME